MLTVFSANGARIGALTYGDVFSDYDLMNLPRLASELRR